MKSSGKALFIVVAMVFGAYASQALASESPPFTSDLRDDCVVDERSECIQRCRTEHDCCNKSCNWVKPRAKSVCQKRCKSALKQCYQECEEKPAVEKATERPLEAAPCSEPAD